MSYVLPSTQFLDPFRYTRTRLVLEGPSLSMDTPTVPICLPVDPKGGGPKVHVRMKQNKHEVYIAQKSVYLPNTLGHTSFR